jgi:hypothetical protein
MEQTSAPMNFIHPQLTPVATKDEEPSYSSIRIARTQLHDNAAAVFSPHGGGIHGHLALTMTPTEYLAVAGVAFVAPVNPTSAPVLDSKSKIQTSENVRLHELAKREFRQYHDVDKALRKQLIEATPATYLQDLRDPNLGYANTTCLQLITHLRETYGAIEQEELDSNTARMEARWHPPVPIEDLFEQLRAGAAFALEGGDVLPPAAVVRLGYTIILQTGFFENACREWRAKATKDKSMADFKKHFKKWDKDRKLTLTAGQAGYHGAANHVDTTTITPPVPQLAPVPPPTTELSELRAEMAAMRVALAAHQAAPTPTVNPHSAPLTLAQKGYCWTHGYSGNLSHTSATCVNTAEGHQKTATHTNRLGGTEKVWSRMDRRIPR